MLLLGSAVLSVEAPGPSVAAQNITAAASDLGPQMKSDAFAQAILQAMKQQGTTGFALHAPDAVAAVSAGSADAVTQAFAKASTLTSHPLQTQTAATCTGFASCSSH